MNKERRKIIREIIDQLSRIQQIVDQVAGDESDSFDSLPENFQEAERGEKMQDAISALEDVSELIETAKDKLDTALE